MAYDAESDRVVLFGGRSEGGLVGETWTYDLNANAWANGTSPSGPSPRVEHAMAYDAESDMVILFGGFDGTFIDDTWVYDLNIGAWTRMDPIPRPSPRYGHALAYDFESDRILLFGGLTFLGGLPVLSNETWTYEVNTDTWTKIPGAGPPSARFAHAMASDPEEDKVLLFGGLTGGPGLIDVRFAGDVWAYDFNDATWTALPTLGPSGRAEHAMTLDGKAAKVVLFGGFAEGGEGPTSARNDTWSHDFRTKTWRDVSEVVGPSPRGQSAMAYDAESYRSVLFGGKTASGGWSDETWTYRSPPPETAIVSTVDGNGENVRNGGSTRSTSITFNFTSEDIVNASFECRLGGAAYTVCTGNLSLEGLNPGVHTFSVRALDRAADPDPTPATFSWLAGAILSSSRECGATIGTDGGGNSIITGRDAMGNLVAEVTLPPGTSFPTGKVHLTCSTIGDNSLVEIAGPTAPYPPGKSLVLASNVSSLFVCVVDTPTSTFSVGLLGECATNPVLSRARIACDGASRDLSGFPEAPGFRTYRCSRIKIGAGDFLRVDGLAFSLVVDGADLDGVLDARDNCLLVPNAHQGDFDLDGIGNECDADFVLTAALIIVGIAAGVSIGVVFFVRRLRR